MTSPDTRRLDLVRRHDATVPTSFAGAGARTPSTRSEIRALVLAVVGSVAACTPRATVPPSSEAPIAPSSTAAPPSTRAPALLLHGGRVMTAAGTIYDEGDVLVRDGVIAAVGAHIEAPAGTKVIDLHGKTVTPGIIDTHSHMGVYAAPGLGAHGDGNEAVAPVTAYVRAADGYWPQDPQIDYARAGGVTTAQILPGSANLIGGRSLTIKLRPGARSAEDARFVGAPEGLKMACGENPKRVYGEKGGPQTRMGNVAGYRRAFIEAQDYRKRWKNYEQKVEDWKSGAGGDERPDPPSRDLGLETLAMVLEGDILVHNHCYRADEMSTMLDLAESFHFKIRSFHHAVEAYKIADRLAAAGTAASVWADWWGFKAEAYDGIRENAAMVSAAGARAIIHSDSATGIQRLNQEAAKAMASGRRAGIEISEDEALRWITLNAAWALGVDGRTGSIEVGKMADLVVWNRTPFSVYAKAEEVYIDGDLVYDADDPAHRPRTDFDVGLRDAERGAP